MLPRLDGFLAGIRLFIRRHHPTLLSLDESAIAAALTHALELSEGRERDEAAALFFASAERSRAFRVASHGLLPLIARNQARAVGLHLGLSDVELAILHARVALGAISFAELRDTFSAALGPVGEGRGRPSPRRPG